MSVMLHHLEDADARPVVVAEEAEMRAVEDEVVIVGAVVDVAEVVSAQSLCCCRGNITHRAYRRASSTMGEMPEEPYIRKFTGIWHDTSGGSLW